MKKGRKAYANRPNVTTSGSGETRYGEEGSSAEEGINLRGLAMLLRCGCHKKVQELARIFLNLG
jgi:hypothetical protein